MKHLIIIILALVVFECQAQKKKSKIKTIPIYSVSNSERYLTSDSAFSAYRFAKGYNNTNTLKPSTHTWHGSPYFTPFSELSGSYRPAMTVTNPDSAGTIKVYINLKRIKWTSDSTFVIETK